MAAGSGPHDDNAAPLSLEGYFEADQYNLEQNRHLRPEFTQLVPVLYQLYDRSVSLFPASSHEMLGCALMLCYKAMLSAAAAIGRAHPDDAAPITRRAIEIVTTAAAVKHDLANLDAWRSTEERLARWKARREGERPRPFSPTIKWPPNQPLIEELRRMLGSLSDAFVHFTPEYEAGQGWHHEIAGDQGVIYLSFHCHNEREIVHELLILATIHTKILKLFDYCFGGVYSADSTWTSLSEQLLAAGGTFAERYLQEGEGPE